MSQFDFSGKLGVPDGQFLLKKKEEKNIDPGSIIGEAINENTDPDVLVGSVTSVGLQDTNDDTTTISGTPVTSSGTLSIDAVSAGEDAAIIWDQSLGKKVYRALSEIGGDGGGTPCVPYWIRFTGDGTERAGSGNLSVAREAEGVYLVTSDDAFDDVDGFFQFGVLATVSSTAGSGADGISPFSEFDDHDVVITGDSDDEDFYYSPATNKIYVLTPIDNKVWIHDLASFTSAATTVTPGDPIRQEGQSGCMSTDGERLYISGDTGGGGYPIRVLETASNTVTVLGTDIDAICIAADSSGNLYTHEAGSVKKYTPNIGTGSLGSVVTTWALNIQSQLCFDHDGNVWGHVGDSIYLMEHNSSDFSRHRFPIPPTGLGSTARIMPDHVNRCVYVACEDVNDIGYLYRYSGWTEDIDDSGGWRRLFLLPSTSGQYVGGWFDPNSGVYFGKDSNSTQTVQRLLPNQEVSLDAVYLDNVTPDAVIDYNLTNSRNSFYLANYGYVIGERAGQTYLIRISYNGPNIGAGSGGAFVTRQLNWAYDIVSSTEAYVYVYTGPTPIKLVDAELTVEFTHCTEGEGGGGGGGASGPIGDTDLTMSTNRLLGRTTASTGAIEEIAITANNGLLLASLALSIDRALQSDMESPTTGHKIVASTTMLYHPGVAKAWCAFDATGGLIGPSYNIGAVTDNGTGDWTVSIAGSFPLSSANGTIKVSAVNATPVVCQCVARSSASAYQIKCWDLTGTLTDPSSINFAIFGDCS